jgi:hypothetical protein
MSLQDDVNEEVGLIHAKLESASAAAGQVESVDVDLSAEIAAIADEQAVDFGPVGIALTAVADAIDALGGDSSAVRAAIAGLGSQSVNLAPVKEALEAAAEVMTSINENANLVATATTDHLAGTASAVDLLIDQSNFSGEAQ